MSSFVTGKKTERSKNPYRGSKLTCGKTASKTISVVARQAMEPYRSKKERQLRSLAMSKMSRFVAVKKTERFQESQ